MRSSSSACSLSSSSRASLREPAQRHVQDVVGLDLAELERAHQLLARGVGVLGRADDLDDLVEVIERDQQAEHDVIALLGLAQVEPCAPRDDVDLMVDVVAHHLGEVQRARDAVDQRQHDDAEVLLQLRVLVELVEHHVRVGAALGLDHQAHAFAVGLVLEVGDVLDLLGLDQVGDLLGEARLVHLVRQLGDDDLVLAVGALFDLGDRADLQRAAAGLVGVADALAAHDRGAGREVGGLDELHQVVRRGLGVVEVVHDAVDHLAEVVRRDVRGHADRDAAGAVDQQVGEPAGQHGGLLLVPVEVGHEVDGLGVDVAQELHGHGCEASLGVPVGGRGVAVDGAEVAVAVDQRVAQRPVLGHAHQRVVDRLVAVRVVLLQHVTDHRGALAVGTVGPVAGLEHGPQDALVDRLQTVAHVGQRAPDDDGHRVVQVRALDLVFELDRLDVADEQAFLSSLCLISSLSTRPGSGRTSRCVR